MNETANAHHVLPLKLYFGVAAALFILTGITVGVSYINFDSILGLSNINLTVALIVATIKGTLVALYFMHLRYDHKIYTMTFLAGLLTLGIFLVFTIMDMVVRKDPDGNPDKPAQIEYAQPLSHSSH